MDTNVDEEKEKGKEEIEMWNNESCAILLFSGVSFERGYYFIIVFRQLIPGQARGRCSLSCMIFHLMPVGMYGCPTDHFIFWKLQHPS